MKTHFENLNINLGENSKFNSRLQIVGELMASKTLPSSLENKLIPLYTRYKGERLLIGYVTDIVGKVTIRTTYPGGSRVFFYADVVITTNEKEILYMAKTSLGAHKKQYKLSFIIHDILAVNKSKPTITDNICCGMVIEFGV